VAIAFGNRLLQQEELEVETVKTDVIIRAIKLWISGLDIVPECGPPTSASHPVKSNNHVLKLHGNLHAIETQILRYRPRTETTEACAYSRPLLDPDQGLHCH